MNPKTDDVQPEAMEGSHEPGGGFTILFLLSTVIAVITIAAWYHAAEDPMGHIPRFFVTPWMIAAGQEILHGLQEFSGRPLEPVQPLPRFLTLTSLFLITVFGPTLYFFGIRERILSRSAIRLRWPASITSIVGTVITLPTMITLLLSVPLQHAAFVGLKEAQAIQYDRDFIINDLNLIAWDIFEYRVRPKSMEGEGGGPAAGYLLPPHLASTEYGRYAIKVVGDQVEIRSESRRYSGATITASVGEKGTLTNWKFEGEFR